MLCNEFKIGCALNIMGLQVNVSKTEVVVFDGENGMSICYFTFACLGRIFLKEGKVAKSILRCVKAG